MAAFDAVRCLTLDLPPSCVAFCPTQSHLFVVGTYYLHGKEHPADPREATADEAQDDSAGQHAAAAAAAAGQKRTGSLILFHLEHDRITRLSTLATDFAILDLQWCLTLPPDAAGQHLLAVATSTGLLAFYRLDAARRQLVPSHVRRVCDAAVLVLSLAWHPSRPHVLGVTLSDGRVLVCECRADGSSRGWWSPDAATTLHRVQQHGAEAWTLAFATTDPATVLSGGDDMLLQSSHIHPDSSDSALLWTDAKLHQAGVTAILPLSDTLVLTGSYDDHIRLLSLPAPGRKRTLASLDLGGGVWRLKLLDPASHSALRPCTLSLVLLASCMHAGARIVRMKRRSTDADDWSFEVLARFERHKSMNYASDVQPEDAGGAAERRIVSTSFYDRLLCLWKFDMSEGQTVASDSLQARDDEQGQNTSGKP